MNIKDAMFNTSDNLTCFYRRCDFMNTQAVYGIEGNGKITNCGRTNKEGIDFQKSDDQGFERYISLYNIPQEYGGCKDCRFFLLCSGGCPGEGKDYDLRNKTINCNKNKELFSFYEKVALESGVIPFSKMNSRKDMELSLINSLIEKDNKTIGQLINEVNSKPTLRSVEIINDIEGVYTIEDNQ